MVDATSAAEPPPVVFHDQQGHKVQCGFLGWRTDRLACFVRSREGAIQILEFTRPAMPGMHYVRNPLPPAPPVEIVSARLLPPPCRGTREQAEALFNPDSLDRQTALHFSPWEIVSGEVLFPRPEDESLIRQRFDASHSAWKLQRDRRANELDHLEALPMAARKRYLKAHVFGRKVSDNKASDYLKQERHALQELYDSPPRYAKRGELISCGKLNLTLEMVMEGRDGEGIRDAVLQRDWAARQGFDLEKLKMDAGRFLNVIRSCCANAEGVVYDSRVRTRHRELHWSQNWNMEQVLLALVRYVIRFQDGTRFWLSGCSLRPPQHSDEAEQIEAVLAAANPSALLHVPRVDACKSLGISDRSLRNLCIEEGIDPNHLTMAQVDRLTKRRQAKRRRKAENLRNRNRKPPAQGYEETT